MDNHMLTLKLMGKDKWAAECPNCSTIIYSNCKYGPFPCPVCSYEFMVSVDGWVDCTGDIDEEEGKED